MQDSILTGKSFELFQRPSKKISYLRRSLDRHHRRRLAEEMTQAGQPAPCSNTGRIRLAPLLALADARRRFVEPLNAYIDVRERRTLKASPKYRSVSVCLHSSYKSDRLLSICVKCGRNKPASAAGRRSTSRVRSVASRTNTVGGRHRTRTSKDQSRRLIRNVTACRVHSMHTEVPPSSRRRRIRSDRIESTHQSTNLASLQRPSFTLSQS
ncbi:hypothetical protein EVAR_7995_1 [Eumeta japonica]|uniref:Uncharacterized protein n=1 Tax=Eumeta variegata TaxID=151549 RepID=A0A4C1TI14_EUMVA|nr:hypothetical protein EVAR_7995_1 [Eumeta japonica]